MKVTVDKDLCIGCGACEVTCPEVFEVGDDGVARVKLEPVPQKLEEAVREAAEDCPVEAIFIEE